MKSFLDRYIYFVPIILLFFGLVTNFIEYKGNTYDYVVLGNSVGWSIIVSIVFYYFFNFKGKYCWLTRNSPIGLFIINVIDIIGKYIGYLNYCKLFNIAICSIISILAIIFYIKKKIEHD